MYICPLLFNQNFFLVITTANVPIADLCLIKKYQLSGAKCMSFIIKVKDNLWIARFALLYIVLTSDFLYLLFFFCLLLCPAFLSQNF